MCFYMYMYYRMAYGIHSFLWWRYNGAKSMCGRDCFANVCPVKWLLTVAIAAVGKGNYSFWISLKLALKSECPWRGLLLSARPTWLKAISVLRSCPRAYSILSTSLLILYVLVVYAMHVDIYSIWLRLTPYSREQIPESCVMSYIGPLARIHFQRWTCIKGVIYEHADHDWLKYMSSV